MVVDREADMAMEVLLVVEEEMVDMAVETLEGEAVMKRIMAEEVAVDMVAMLEVAIADMVVAHKEAKAVDMAVDRAHREVKEVVMAAAVVVADRMRTTAKTTIAIKTED